MRLCSLRGLHAIRRVRACYHNVMAKRFYLLNNPIHIRIARLLHGGSRALRIVKLFVFERC